MKFYLKPGVGGLSVVGFSKRNMMAPCVCLYDGLSVSVSVSPSVCPSVCPSILPSFGSVNETYWSLCTCQSVSLSFCLSINLCLRHLVHWMKHIAPCAPVCLSVCHSLCLSVLLSFGSVDETYWPLCAFR